MTEETSHGTVRTTGKHTQEHTHTHTHIHTRAGESSLELITITMKSSTTVIAENHFY